MIRLRSLRKNAHSSLRFLLILGMAAPFCRFYRGNGIGGVWCMVSVSFSGIFPSVCPLKKVGDIADRGKYRGRFCVVSVSFWGGVQRSISHSKGVSKMETPFPVGVEQNGTPLPLPIPAHLFCPFLPEHGGKVGFDLLQLSGSGFLLPVFGVKPVFLGNQGFIFCLQSGSGG